VAKQEIEFNLNQSIKVKLKPLGIGILYKRHEDLDNRVKARVGRGISSFEVKTDEEGYTTFQAWEFMEIFGEHTGICKPEAFELNIKILIK